MDSGALFRGKKITLLGLGLLGRGVGDAAFLAECGADLIVSDKKSAEELAPSLGKLKKYPNIVFHLGEQPLEDFENRDLIVKAAGIPQDSPHVAVARAAGIPIVMSTALFAQHAQEAGAKIVGITGTRGKSTVTQMIYHTLKLAGKRAHLGGNVRGLSTLAILPEVAAGDICVLELDSWQLQGFGDLRLSPHIAIFTNLMPDHMNYYRGNMDAYFEDKAQIYRHQKAADVLICGASIAKRIRASNPPLDPVVPDPLPKAWKIQVPGEHNRENASLAVAALQALGLTDTDIQKGLESFEAVEGRLQFVREVDGVKIYNDNNATTPEATIAALKALGSNIILIAGGSDKGLALEELVAAIAHTCKKVVLLDGEGTHRLLKSGLQAEVFAGTAAALTAARAAATAGDTILFSPGFASFGMFKNEYERNDQFLSLVRAL